jgi:hypothetical protein
MTASPDAFGPQQLDEIVTYFAANGFVRVAGVFSDEQLTALQADMERCQRDLLLGLLPEQCGTVILDDPDAMVALGYDALRLLADAMKRAGSTDPAKVNEAIASTKDFPGITGKITLDEHRNPNKPAVMLQVKNGKFVYVESVAP